MSIRVAIFGSSGFVGAELLRLCAAHPELEPSRLFGDSQAGSALAAVRPELVERYFVQEGEHYRVSAEIREPIVFSVQDLLSDPPFTKLNLLSCRNLLIYLEPALQERLVRVFHFALDPGGVLMLGRSESPGVGSSGFVPLAETAPYVYRRATRRTADLDLQFAVRASRAMTNPPEVSDQMKAIDTLALLTDRRLLQGYAPAAVLVNAEGDILYISGRTGRYLEPAAGKADWNVHSMAREGLQTLLAGALRKAVKDDEIVPEGRPPPRRAGPVDDRRDGRADPGAGRARRESPHRVLRRQRRS